MDIFNTLQELSRISNSASVPDTLGGFRLEEDPSQEPLDDGGKRINTAICNPDQDPYFRLGTWKLRLVPMAAADGGLRIPIHILVNADESFRELQAEVARFELEADTNHLVAAHLETQPNTHLTQMSLRADGTPVPVRLLGPGMTLILRGSNLDDWDVDFSGAQGTEEGFPSARFEPPHFKIANTDIGVVCDAIILDLKRDANPAIVAEKLPDVDETWRGLILKELGVFIGDGSEVGTWSGMAAMKNFFISFDAIDLSGTFIAELVHYAVDASHVYIYYQDESVGDEVQIDEGTRIGDIAPRPGSRYRRFRLRAEPNWDSAGFRVDWQPPRAVRVEEPSRLTSLNLGWVQAPPSGPDGHEFHLVISDHRVNIPEITFHIAVPEPALSEGASEEELRVSFEGALLDAGRADDDPYPTNRLHLVMHPGQQARLTASMGFGSGDEVRVTLSLPDGFTCPDDLGQTVNRRPADSNEYERAEWIVTAPDPLPAQLDWAFVIEAVDGAVTKARRLRVSLEQAPGGNQPDFELYNLCDWLAEPGIGLTHFRLLNGLEFSDITWTLESETVDNDQLHGEDRDARFTGGDWGVMAEPLELANSAGTVRPYLGQDSRLWRLTGRVGAGTGGSRISVVIGQHVESQYHSKEVASYLSGTNIDSDEGAEEYWREHPYLNFYAPAGLSVPTIVFHHDCDQIQPPSDVCTDLGPEAGWLPEGDPWLDHSFINTEQARGFAALFRAIEQYGDQIQEVGLFGTASAEGRREYNLDLSQRRVAAVLTALNNPPSELETAMAGLADAAYTLTAEVRTLVSNLVAAESIKTYAFGEAYARWPVDPKDRCVFAVLKLSAAAPSAEIVHREYFVTLPDLDWPSPVTTPALPRRQLQNHPFHHAVFRQAYVEVELLHNELVRLQVRLKLDLEKINENDVMPGGSLNDLDGLTTFFLEMKRNPAPEEGQPQYSWEIAALADPGDVDGFMTLQKTEETNIAIDLLGPPAILTPALTALAGGRIGLWALAIGFAVGEILANIPNSTEPILDVQTLIWRGIRFRLLHGNVDMPTISLAVDYTVRYDLNADIGYGIDLSTTQPIEITFRNVGVEVRPGSTIVEFFYDPAQGFALDINDPGVFTSGGGLGQLLNVNRFRSGAGSPLWFELELALAFETGIITVDTLRIRVSLDTEQLFEADGGHVALGNASIQWSDFSISLNKIGVALSVPQVLEGKGSMGFSDEVSEGEEASVIEAELDISLVPLKFRIYGGLKYVSTETLRALYVYLGMEFSPGISLGPTGAAIYGFFGLVGVNMGRKEYGDPADYPEPLRWFASDPVGVTSVDKWVPARGNWAFGVGTVIGTIFDTGFTFNLKGSFILEIPGPKFMLGAEAKFIQARPKTDDASRGELVCVVMLDFENNIFLIGIEFKYVKENLIELRVPVEVFFNLSDASDWHIRLGQWYPESKRITLKLLNLFKAWGYFVVEGGNLQIDDVLNLRGPCLALGSRIEIFWGSRHINLYLEAYVEFHLGLQFDPIQLQGMLRVGGELHLVVITLGARGELRIIAPNPFVLKGEICGKIDLWLFSIEGCASFTIGDREAELPPPPNPFQQVTVIERMTSAAAPDLENAPEDSLLHHNAPLDCVLHLIFNQNIIDDRPEGQRGMCFTPGGMSLRNQVSDKLCYEYHLESLVLRKVSDRSEVVIRQNAWAPYSLPGARPEEAASTRTLRVLDWPPNAHPRALDFEGAYGETVSDLFGTLCDPTPRPTLGCATFDEEPLGARSLWRLNQGGLRTLQVIAGMAGSLDVAGFQPARVVSRPSVSYGGRAAQNHALRLPAAGQESWRSPAELLSELAELIDSGEPLSEAFWLAGVVLIQLPDLVVVRATFILPERLTQDGAAALLDEHLHTLRIFTLQDQPVVAGSTGSGRFARHLARRLDYGPPRDDEAHPPRAAWLAIFAPGPQYSSAYDPYAYLNEICGIKYGAWRTWQDREGDKTFAIETLQGLTSIVGGVPMGSEQMLLDPGEEYQVEGVLSWKRFRDMVTVEEDGSDTFRDAGDLSFNQTFQTTDQAPVDITPYVLSHDPPDDQQPHYYADTVQIMFAADVVDRLFEKFGKQLVARAKADLGGERALNQPMSEGLERQYFPYGSFEEILYETLVSLEGECLPGAWENLFPKPVLPFRGDLKPNTGYTVSLIPRPLGEPEGITPEDWERTLQADFDANKAVYRFNLRTSRWGSFTDHVAAYREKAVWDIFSDDESSLDAALAEISENRSDEAVEVLCQAMFAGPLAIPDKPQTALIWVAYADGFRCRGILLDGPEPLLKLLPDGTPRVSVDARWSDAPDTDYADTYSLEGRRVIASKRGGRVFILFNPSDPPPYVQVQLSDSRVVDEAGGVNNQVLVLAVGDTPDSIREEGS